MFDSDKPISSFEEDKLNRSGFAKHLAEAILQFSSTDNYAIGLYGQWGCGKTSIINMALTYLKNKSAELPEDKQPIVVKFNPWNFTDCNQLINQFFVVLSSELDINNNSEKQASVGEAIEKYSSALEYTEFVPFVGKFLKLLPSLAKNIGASLKKNASLKLNDVSYRKKEVEKALLGLNSRILIVIDDIDRLPNEQIRLIFQLVNSVAGFPNVTYLLSFDKNIVARALSEVQQCDGEEYLEKIIQVPFEVPNIDLKKIYNVLFARLDSIVEFPKNMEFDKEHWSSIFNSCISPFIKSLRDVNRFFNTFQFQYLAIKQEVDFIDLAGIAALQIFSPAITKWIKENKSNLFGGNPFDGVSLNEIKQNREKYIQDFKTIYPKNPELMVESIASLFPKFSNKVSYSNTYIDNNELRQKMRIASEKRFDIYFSLSLDNISIHRDEIERLIFEMDEEALTSLINNMNENGLASTFLSELSSHLTLIPLNRLEIFIRGLLHVCGHLQGESEGLFSSTASIQCLRVVNNLLFLVEDEEKRYGILKDLFKAVDFLSFQSLASLLNKIELSHGKLQQVNQKKNN